MHQAGAQTRSPLLAADTFLAGYFVSRFSPRRSTGWEIHSIRSADSVSRCREEAVAIVDASGRFSPAVKAALFVSLLAKPICADVHTLIRPGAPKILD